MIPKGLLFAIGSGALWGALLVLPLWLTDFSASDITGGRFLFFSGFTLVLVMLYRRDSLRYLNNGGIWHFLRIALFGNLFFYLMLVASIKYIGAVPACVLVGVLPMIGWRYVDSGTQSEKEFLPVLALICLAMLFAVASQDKPVTHEAFDPWLPGVMFLLAAATSWLYSASRQYQMARLHPEIDTSDHFLLTGMLVIPGLLMMSPLLFSGDSIFGLDISEHSYERSRLFWVSMLGMAGLGTLLARLLWKQCARREPYNQMHWHSLWKSVFGLAYVFLLEQRWPDTLELCSLTCFGLGVIIYGRQRARSLCLKA